MSDDFILDPSIPGNTRNAARARLQRKVANAQSAYQCACFYHELLQVNPHLQKLCVAQVTAQMGWADTNAKEAELIAKEMGNTTEHTSTTSKVKWIDQQVEAAQFWAAEVQVLHSRVVQYNTSDAPAWVLSRLTDLHKRAGSLAGGVADLLVIIMPAMGRGALTQVVNVKTLDGLEPLNMVDDRTTEQKLEDGDLENPPSHCKNCGAQLVLVTGKTHNYVHCVMCSDPARYYLLKNSQGNWYLDPNPPTTHTRKKGTVS